MRNERAQQYLKRRQFWANNPTFDAGAILSSSKYQGIYKGTQVHPPDLQYVIKRASAFGVRGFIIPTGDLEEAKKAIDICQKTRNVYMTIGLHPCRAMQPYKKSAIAENETGEMTA